MSLWVNFILLVIYFVQYFVIYFEQYTVLWSWNEILKCLKTILNP